MFRASRTSLCCCRCCCWSWCWCCCFFCLLLLLRARRRSLSCCRQRSFDIGWPGGAGRGVVRLELKMRQRSRCFLKTQSSTIPGNTSNEKDVRLDDSATITSSNCFRRLGWILDWAVRVSYILVDMIMTWSDHIEQYWQFRITPEAPVPYLVTSVQAARPPPWTVKRALHLVRWGV